MLLMLFCRGGYVGGRWCHGQAPATVALVGARVIDGTGAAPIANATILISNGRIDRVGPAASLKIPAGATRVDVAGKTIIPGLVNAHGHLGHGDSTLPVYDQIIQQLQLYPKFGVTTVYALGDDGVQSVRVSEENNNGPLTRARLFVSGARATAGTAEEARKTIADRHALRVNIIKTGIGEGNSGADMRPEVYTALIDEAHKRKLRVAAHLVNLADAKGLVNAGLDVIAHSIRDQDVDAAFIAELKRRNVGYIPTLTRDLSVFQYESTPDYMNDPFFLRGMPLYAPQIERVKDPALHAKTKANPGTAASEAAIRAGAAEPEVAVRRRRDDRDGHRQRHRHGPLAGLLRAGRDGADGEGRHDADADARRLHRQRRESDGHRQGSGHAAARQARRLRRADRRSARRHQEHTDD